ncbi:MAG: sigma-70 family RNA polymerase sigma factor [Planctomycetes bacterium]|nr:sigma-70 family RNA polymerase sigma factor [Planctomycetota bacterium]
MLPRDEELPAAESPDAGPSDAILDGIVRELDLASTGDLIRQARGGDAESFGELCDRLSPWLEALIAGQWRGRDPAFGREDLKSTVLRRAFQHRADFAGEQRAQLAAWLRRIVGHAMLDVIRGARAAKRDRHREVPLAEIVVDMADDGSTVEDKVVRTEDRTLLRRHLAAMAAKDREVIEAVYLDGMSLANFAARIEIGREAAKKRHARALQRLAAMFKAAPEHTDPGHDVSPPGGCGRRGDGDASHR